MTPARQYQLQLATLQLTIDTQAAEIRHLRRQLGLDQDADTTLRLVRATGLNYGEATLLQALYRAGGSPVSAHRLLATLDARDHAQERTAKQIGVRVHWIRQKLGRGVIGSSVTSKCGYWITDAGKAVVDRVLQQEKAA